MQIEATKNNNKILLHFEGKVFTSFIELTEDQKEELLEKLNIL